MKPFLPEHFSPYNYNNYNLWVKKQYGGRLQKISLDANFTCPNRDGVRGVGGCTFCNNRSFTPGYLMETKDIQTQLEIGLEFLKRRYPNIQKFLAYFQTYSNTYADIDYLKTLYQKVLEHPEIGGIAIGTRPDCLPDKILDYLAELAKEHIIELEIGIESCDEAVLQECNRGHTFTETKDAIRRAAERELFITGHILLGLPKETRQTAIEGAKKLANLPIDALKFHQLHIVKGTQLANVWRKNPEEIPLMDHPTYLDWVVDILEHLPQTIKVQRLSSSVPEYLRVIPEKGERIENLPAMLDERLKERNTWQGKKFINL